MKATSAVPAFVHSRRHSGAHASYALLVATLLALILASPASAQDWRTLSRARQFNGERALAVEIEYGAGSLQVKPGSPDLLYRTSLRYDADAFEPRYSFSDNRLRLGFESGQMKGHKTRGGSLALQLGQRVPLDLQLQFGAAEADIELGGLSLERLQVTTGASKTRLKISKPNLIEADEVVLEAGAASLEVIGIPHLRAREVEVSGGVGELLLDFTGEWRRDLEMSIQMGLGSLTLRVPRGLGVKLTREGFLAGFDSEGLTKRGDVYYSERYDDARHHLVVELEAALGNVRIVWVDG